MAEEVAADADVGGLIGASEFAGQGVEPLLAVEAADGDLQFGPTVVQEPAQLVLGAGALVDERLAVVDKQSYLACVVVEERDGQGVETFGEGRACDGDRVDGVALATIA